MRCIYVVFLNCFFFPAEAIQPLGLIISQRLVHVEETFQASAEGRLHLSETQSWGCIGNRFCSEWHLALRSALHKRLSYVLISAKISISCLFCRALDKENVREPHRSIMADKWYLCWCWDLCVARCGALCRLNEFTVVWVSWSKCNDSAPFCMWQRCCQSCNKERIQTVTKKHFAEFLL